MFTKKGVTIIENPNPNEPITEGEKYFKEIIINSDRFEGWTLYEQPVINSMHPDYILTHREKGILIIEVKDWHLNPPQYLGNAQVLGANGKYFTSNPVDQVISYKEMISKYELYEYLEATERFAENSLAMITTIVYFHVANREQALSFCGYPNPRSCLIWTRQDLEQLCLNNQRDPSKFPECLFYPRSNFAKDPSQTMQKLVDNLDTVLRPSDYARERKEKISLYPEQLELIPIKPGRPRRWSGVAGSGKTLILSTKAAEAIKAGHNVLILTFNITLRHYIRDLCSQQFGEGNRRLLKSHLTIAHFHGFLKILMTELGIKVSSSDDFELYTNQVISSISERILTSHPDYLKYDCILIDEGQDFTGQWIMFLKQFYTAKGEILIMYDKAQSIYEGRGIWITDSTQNKGIGFSGPPGNLKVSHRLPESIVHQIDRLSGLFNMKERIVSKFTQGDLFTKIEWMNILPFDNRTNIILEKINSILNDKISRIEDITIITMQEDTGIEIVNSLSNQPFSISHVYDLSGQGDYGQRRNEKWRFQPGKGKLKVCSYHSYKGWESSHIIFLLEEIGEGETKFEEMRKALYIALTRINSFSDSRSFTCINNCVYFNYLSKYF